MSRFALTLARPRSPMNPDFLKRKIDETVAQNGCEFSGAVVDSGYGKPGDPITIGGHNSPVMDTRSEIQFRDFEFKCPVTFSNHWAMLSLHDSTFSDFIFRGSCSELFLGNKTKAKNLSVSSSRINGLIVYDTRLLGGLTVERSFIRIIFIKRMVIEGDLDFSGLLGVNHIELVKTKVYGRIIVPTGVDMAFFREKLRDQFGDKVVLPEQVKK